MRVLYVSRGLGSPKYGAERISKLIMEHLEPRVDLYSLTDDRTFTGKGEVFYNPTYRFKIPFFEYVFYRIYGKRKIKKVCKRFEPDVILSSVYSGYAIPTPKNIKSIIHFHDEPGVMINDDISPSFVSFLLRIWYGAIQFFKKKVIKRRYYYYSISTNMTKCLVNLGIEKDKIFTSPYGLFLKHTNQINIEEKWLEIQDYHKLEDKDFILLFVGVLYYTKGIHTIIEALKIVNKNNIKLLEAGSEMPFFGKFYTKKIRSRIKEYNLVDQIKWLGYVDTQTIITLYNRCSALVSASYSEGCQLTLIEASQYGLPIITSKSGSAVEQFSECAQFFNAGNETELSDIILKINKLTTEKIDCDIYLFEECIDKLVKWSKSLA